MSHDPTRDQLRRAEEQALDPERHERLVSNPVSLDALYWCPNCGLETLRIIERTEPDDAGEFKDICTCDKCENMIHIFHLKPHTKLTTQEVLERLYKTPEYRALKKPIDTWKMAEAELAKHGLKFWWQD
jgi:hypothetical protein